VVGAADPEPQRLIRWAALEVVFENDGYLGAIVASMPVMGYLRGADHLLCRDQAPAAATAPPSIRGAKRGANLGRRQATPGDNQPQFPQLDRPSGLVQPHAATRRMRLKAEARVGRPGVGVWTGYR
jgi:hypothetical protein